MMVAQWELQREAAACRAEEQARADAREQRRAASRQLNDALYELAGYLGQHGRASEALGVLAVYFERTR